MPSTMRIRRPSSVCFLANSRGFSSVAAIFVTAIAATAQADWPQLMGPAGSGIAAPEEKIAKSFPAEGPRELWHISLAEGFSSPAVVGGKVYVLDRPDEGTKEKLLVLDLATGHEEWSVEYESQPFKKVSGVTRSVPAVDGTMAYTIGVTGDLVAYDLVGKKLAWRKNLKKDFGARPLVWGIATSPVVLENRLLVDTAGSPRCGVVALDKKTGEQVWASAPFGTRLDTHTTPVVTTIDNVRQVIGWHQGAVMGISAVDGKTLWKYEWAADQQITSPLHIGNGRIFLMTGHKVGCAMLDVKRTGDQWQVKEVFKDKRSGALLSNAIFYKGFIYTNASDKYKLQCLDSDGNVKWEGKKFIGNSPIIIVDGTIMIMHSTKGTVFMVEASPQRYKELASAKVLEYESMELLAPLVVDSGKLLLRDDKTLKCLDIAAK